MIKVNTATLTATREAIPRELKGLTNETLRNLQSELNPVPPSLVDIEYWPEVRVVQNLLSTEKFTDEILTVQVGTKDVAVSYVIEDKTAEELAAEEAVMAAKVRSERDSKLAPSDWMGLSDNTMTPEWAAYRQALRDVPAQEGFPHTVVWPT